MAWAVDDGVVNTYEQGTKADAEWPLNTRVADFSAATGGVLLLLWVGQLLAGRAVRRAARRPATFPVLDELEPLLASADTAVGLAASFGIACSGRSRACVDPLGIASPIG